MTERRHCPGCLWHRTEASQSGVCPGVERAAMLDIFRDAKPSTPEERREFNAIARRILAESEPPAYVPSDLDALLIEQFADKVVKEHPWWVVTELRALAARMRGKT